MRTQLQPPPPLPRPTVQPMGKPAPAPHVQSRQPGKTPAAAVPSTPLGPTRLQVFAVQLHLDRANFAPGALDGHWGAKSAKALCAWQQTKNLPQTGELADALRRPELAETNGLFTTYVVTAQDLANLRLYPDTWRARAAQDLLSHTTIEEYVAETFHISRAALRWLNPGVSWPTPSVGTVLQVPYVHARRIPRPAYLEIHTQAKSLRAYNEEGRLLAQFPCSIAADRTKHNIGETLHITRCAKNPDYTYDPALFEDAESRAATRKLRIPPGPNNPVGVAWMGLSLPGYGIHGTPEPELIGRTESHGCFRLANWDAAKLLNIVYTGLPVRILP